MLLIKQQDDSIRHDELINDDNIYGEISTGDESHNEEIDDE